MNLFSDIYNFAFNTHTHTQKAQQSFRLLYNSLVLNLDTVFKTPSIAYMGRQQLGQPLTFYYARSPSIYLLVGIFILSHPLSKVCTTK